MLRLASRAALPAVLTLAAVAYGAHAATRAPVLGAPDKPIAAGEDIAFTLQDGSVQKGKDVFLEVSRSSSTRGEGRLSAGTLPARGNAKVKSFTRKMTYSRGQYRYTLKASDYSYLKKGQFWAATPATYFWSAFVVDCESESDCVREAAKPNRIIINPPKEANQPSTP